MESLTEYKAIHEKRDLSKIRLMKIQNKQKKQAIVVTIFWMILALVISIMISSLFSFNTSPVRNFIYSFVMAIVIVNWIYFLPFLGVMIIVIIRTRSRNFFFQLVPNLGLLIIITIVALINQIQLKEDIFAALFVIFLLGVVIIESIFLRLVVQGAKKNKKPLFLWTFFQNSFEAYSSTILAQQALLINEELNGYSQRPFFTDFPEITQYCVTDQEFVSRMSDYAKFLVEKSELIGWDIKENKNSIALYPRVLMGELNLGLGIRYIWKLFNRVLKKQLTTINVNFSTPEISLRIVKQDYELLSEVTYHQLGQLVLQRFKQSILEFLEGNIDKSYRILFPLDK